MKSTGREAGPREWVRAAVKFGQNFIFFFLGGGFSVYLGSQVFCDWMTNPETSLQDLFHYFTFLISDKAGSPRKSKAWDLWWPTVKDNLRHLNLTFQLSLLSELALCVCVSAGLNRSLINQSCWEIEMINSNAEIISVVQQAETDPGSARRPRLSEKNPEPYNRCLPFQSSGGAFRNTAICHLQRWLNRRYRPFELYECSEGDSRTVYQWKKRSAAGSRSFPLCSWRVATGGESFCFVRKQISSQLSQPDPHTRPVKPPGPVLTLPQSLPVSVLTRPPYCSMGAGRTRPVTSVMSLCTTMPNSFR